MSYLLPIPPVAGYLQTRGSPPARSRGSRAPASCGTDCGPCSDSARYGGHPRMTMTAVRRMSPGSSSRRTCAAGRLLHLSRRVRSPKTPASPVLPSGPTGPRHHPTHSHLAAAGLGGEVCALALPVDAAPPASGSGGRSPGSAHSRGSRSLASCGDGCGSSAGSARSCGCPRTPKTVAKSRSPRSSAPASRRTRAAGRPHLYQRARSPKILVSPAPPSGSTGLCHHHPGRSPLAAVDPARRHPAPQWSPPAGSRRWPAAAACPPGCSLSPQCLSLAGSCRSQAAGAWRPR